MRLRNVKGSIEAVKQNELVVQQPETLKGKWREYFGNDNPIHIEVGMGKGQFVTTHAVNNPNINYVGIEKYSGVLFKAIDLIKEAAVSNLGCIRMDALDLPDVFEDNEVDRLYLNFSDPWPKERHYKRRLTYKDFLVIYHKLLKPTGDIVFKTDNDLLFEFSVEQIKAFGMEITSMTNDLHADEPEDNVRTEYEQKFSEQGIKINRLIALNTERYLGEEKIQS